MIFLHVTFHVRFRQISPQLIFNKILMVYPRKYFMYKVLNFFPKLIFNVTHHKTYGSGLTAAIEVRKI